MKRKLRKINIGDKKYLWCLSISYIKAETKHKEYRANIKLKVYLDGMKNTPLKVIFDVPDDPVIGTQITYGTEGLNLNRPYYVRMIIEKSIARGWEPEKEALNIKNGLAILEESGIDTAGILHNNEL